MTLTQVEWEGVDWIYVSVGDGPVAGSCGIMDSIKGGVFEYAREKYFLKNYSAHSNRPIT
jgi:hypothetical protein